MELDEKFGKIVNLAKRGEGGEKENAVAIVRRICAERDLDFDAVMADAPVKRRFQIDCGKKLFQLCLQVVMRYGMDDVEDVRHMTSDEGKTVIAFNTTEAMFLEAQYAFDIMARSYEAEKKRTLQAFHLAFLTKHSLFYLGPGWEEFNKEMNTEISEEKRREYARAHKLVRDLEDVSVGKALPPPVDNGRRKIA